MKAVGAAGSPAALATAQSAADFLVGEAHRRSVAERIVRALSGGRALVVLTGSPPPSGRDLAAALGSAAGSRYRVIVVASNPEFGPETLQRAASELAEPQGRGTVRQEASLLSRVRPPLPLFLLERAERLSDAQLEAITVIADMAVAAIVLLAEAGFRARLEGAALCALNERLTAAFAFQELGGEETQAFIRHQLGAGASARVFSSDIVAAIAEAAGGDTALVALLARYVLDYATARGEMPPRSLLSAASGQSGAGALVPIFPAGLPVEHGRLAVATAPAAKAAHFKARRFLKKGPLLLAFVAGLAVAGNPTIVARNARPPRVHALPAEAGARVSLSAAEIAALLQRGDDFLASGDIASARLFYKPAAAAGNREAALHLAETYDPRFLRRAGVRGIPGDLRLAREWYRRARALGSAAGSGGSTRSTHP